MGLAPTLTLPTHEALTSFFLGTLTVSLRLSSRAICNLRSSPRLRRSSCRGQWHCNNITECNRTKQHPKRTWVTKSDHAVLQRKIRKQPVIQLFCLRVWPRGLVPSPTHPSPHVASLVLGSQRADGGEGHRHHQVQGKGTLILQCFYLKMKMALYSN